jgi:hypothetical protein
MLNPPLFVSCLGSYLFPALLLVGASTSPPIPAACSYAHFPPATRYLLHRIDQTLPHMVRRRRQADPDGRMPYVEVDSCFRPVLLSHLFPQAAEARLRQHLRQVYYKQLADPSLQHQHVASLLVLEYASSTAATAAKHSQDSLRQDLEQRCPGSLLELEPCGELASYRFTRVGAHLLHYTLYSQDPNWRTNLHALAAALTGRLLAPVRPTPRPRPATRRRTAQ